MFHRFLTIMMAEIDGTCLKLQHPFCIMVAGPTMCGKTAWVSKMIKHDMIEPPPEKIIWSYKSWQDLYDTLDDKVQFVRGDDIEVDRKQRTLVIIDDQMNDINDKVVDWFIRGCHHDNMSLVFITQNLLFPDKRFRTASLNCHYMVLFRNPRDSGQVRCLARQMYPGKSNGMIQAFEDATSIPYGTLFVDLKPTTPEKLRLRSNIFDEMPVCYLV